MPLNLSIKSSFHSSPAVSLPFERLLSQALVISPQALHFALIAVDLLLLHILSSFLSHELVADQGARNKPDRPADERTHSCMTNGATDNGSGAGPHAATDKTALFPRSERLGATKTGCKSNG
jgi:hypothetical protein